MTVASTPHFLVIEVPDLVAARQCFDEMSALVPASGGVVLAAALPRDVEVLEAGTALAAVFIGRWPTAERLQAFWNRAGTREAFASVETIPGSRAVSVIGIADVGLPGDFLPTVATVKAPTLPTPPAYMLIQGTVVNLAPIEQYVATIMPMLRERLGYYVVYAVSPAVTVLHGDWQQQAYILSRWPTLTAARDFWYCERYQDIAIPTRTGHGTFTVLLMPGLAG